MSEFPEIDFRVYPPNPNLDVILALRAIYDLLVEIQTTVDAIGRGQ